MSEPTFDLLEEPWVPVTLLAGGQPTALSLRQTLARAAEIREIADPAPTVTVALHRLLLAILHRALDGPRSPAEWHELRRAGAWDMTLVGSYLATWRARFDLFDARQPFYQNGNIGFDEAKPMAYMVHGMTVGNNATLFDHSVDRRPAALSPAPAARYLVALHAFALGGFVTSAKGEDRGKVGSAYAAPLARGVVTLASGRTLFETLLLNLVRYDPEEGVPFEGRGDDRPAWERDEPTRPESRRPHGYLDLLTWQSRRVRLQPEWEGERLVVRRAAVMKGNQFADDWAPWGAETMLAYRPVLRPSAGQAPFALLDFREDRALWRDSTTLISSLGSEASRGARRPRVIDWLARLAEEGELERAARYQLSALGVASDRKSIDFWRAERLPLPARLLTDDNLVALLRRALDLAEAVGRLFLVGRDEGAGANGKPTRFPRPMQLFAETLAAPSDEVQANPDTVKQIVAALAPERAYWPRLELPFRQFVDDLVVDEGVESLPRWSEEVRRAAWAAFDETMRGFDRSARALKAEVRARQRFAAGLNAALRRHHFTMGDAVSPEGQTEGGVEHDEPAE